MLELNSGDRKAKLFPANCCQNMTFKQCWYFCWYLNLN